MTWVNAGGLALIYLMAVASWSWWDIATAAALAVVATQWIERLVLPRLPGQPLESMQWRPAALSRLARAAAADFAAGSFRALRLLVTARARPGFIEVQTEAASEASLALSTFLLTLAPDSFVVHSDAERHVIVLHVLDIGRAEVIRAGHRTQYRRDIAPLFSGG